MSRANRLLRLVQLLRRHRRPVSAASLADELGVSVRSVYRDINALREQGASIEGAAGAGYQLRPGFLLPPLMFTDEELEAIVLGLRLTAEHGDEALGRAAAEVVAKLRAVLPRDLKTLVDETALLAGPSQRRPPEQVDLAEVRRCVREQRKARIVYADGRGAASERVVWPIAIGFFERARVVVAWCEARADFRSFRADRIARWTTSADRIGRPRAVLLTEWRAREAIPAQLPG
ncbi:helix-turn-helix transcriptional regulator [Sorangium sp. So ce131]|uniref:helix-turn-helix transcriptional regulator n=1 Tax=Sorangium sp. So ce131 TaxID=3133282 RepID=UPI003F619A1C